MCGALARRLHETYADEPATQIRREWNNRQFDIAVLRHGTPMALIEAKAAMSFDLLKGGNQPFPIKPVLKDIEKLRRIEFESER